MYKKLKDKRQKAKDKKYINCILLFLVLILPFVTNAQCAMCRASLEGEGNIEKAKAVNDGIVYLMVIPYLLVGIIGIIIYRMWKNKKV